MEVLIWKFNYGIFTKNFRTQWEFAGFIYKCFSRILRKREDDDSKILRKILLGKMPFCPLHFSKFTIKLMSNLNTM